MKKYASRIESNFGRKLSEESRAQKSELNAKESRLAKIDKKIARHDKVKKAWTMLIGVVGFMIGSLTASFAIMSIHGPVMTAPGVFLLFFILATGGGLYAWAVYTVSKLEMEKRKKRLDNEKELLIIEIAELKESISESREKAKYVFELSNEDHYAALIPQH